MDYIDKEYLNKMTSTPIEVINSDIIYRKVSVLLITYNHAKTIGDSIDGILRQRTSFDFELILGDDESTDGTREICLEYAKQYPKQIKLFLHSRDNNIRVLGKPCGIFQIAYNLLCCHGKYIAICSGDDVWTDLYKLQKQFEFLEKNSRYSLCYHAYKLVTKDYSNPSVRRDFPKASTMFFRNVADKIPKHFIDVIQEDMFLWFILKHQGDFYFDSHIKPTHIYTPENSITRSMDSKDSISQNLNFNYYLMKSYKDSNNTMMYESTYRFIHSFLDYRLHNKFMVNIRIVLYEIGILKVVKVLLWRIFTRNLNLSFK